MQEAREVDWGEMIALVPRQGSVPKSQPQEP